MVAVVASRVFLYAFDVAYVELQQQLVAEGLRTEKSPDERGRGRAAPDAGLDVAFPRQELGSLDARRRQRVAAKVSVRLPELPARVVGREDVRARPPRRAERPGPGVRRRAAGRELGARDREPGFIQVRSSWALGRHAARAAPGDGVFVSPGAAITAPYGTAA